MKRLLLLLIAPFLVNCSSDDDAVPNEIILSTQAEVDAFAASGQTETTKEVYIGPKDYKKKSDITSLAALHTLTATENLHIVRNPLLTSLEGLENLTIVSDTLTIGDNDMLSSIEALHSLNHVGAIGVDSNKSLLHLKGLEGVTTLATLNVFDNQSMLSLEGVNNLTSIRDRLEIGRNPLLGSLDGLEALTSAELVYINGTSLASIEVLQGVEIFSLWLDGTALTDLSGLNNNVLAWYMTITNNTHLESLEGFSENSNIGSLTIENNSNLSSLTALESLYSFDEKLVIKKNAMLASLDGLQNISTQRGGVEISDNSSLSDFCALRKVVNENANYPGFIIISNNNYNPTFQDIYEQRCSRE